MTDRNSIIEGLSPEGQAVVAKAAALEARYPDSEIRKVPKDGDYDHRFVAEGLLNAIVCTRKTAAEAAEWLTEVRPPGTSHNRWEPDDDHDPVPCQNRPDTHRHVIVSC